MECKKCRKIIENSEDYCLDCKQTILQEELNDLIEENKQLNELENTKELDELSNLTEETIEEKDIKDELKDIVKVDDEEKQVKNNKKKIIIIVCIISIFILLIVTILLLLLNKNSVEEPKEKVINYKEVINKYGNNVKEVISNLTKEGEGIPSWDIINKLITYDEYKVECNIHEIYDGGEIFLDECMIENEITSYTYGTKQEIARKTINIYKHELIDGAVDYDQTHGENMVGSISCKTNDCEYIKAYEKYVIINENNAEYVYNYETDDIEFGPFIYDDSVVLTDTNKAYGILYKENGIQKIYNFDTKKTLNNINGNLFPTEYGPLQNLLFKYGYVIFENNGTNEFVSLKNGLVSYSIDGKIIEFNEDYNNKIAYITTLNELNNKITIYNSNGKKLFNGNEQDEFLILDNKLVIINDNQYKIYDSNLNLKQTSRVYDKILGIWDSFAAVVYDKKLALVDSNDKLLTTFDLIWDEEKHCFINSETKITKDKISLIIEIEEDDDVNFYEYYYLIKEKKNGVEESALLLTVDKPILYLYPENKTNVKVSFSNPKILTTTYPKYKNVWEVVAYPNGDLYDKNNNYYYGLYWEERLYNKVDFSEGFYVEKDDAIKFLEEKLNIIGLNKRERNEFIMYWLPILEKNGKNLVYFELTDERNKYSKLNITPEPDSMLRIAIHIKKVNKKTSIKKQKLNTFKRYGFSAIEWGGVNYK